METSKYEGADISSIEQRMDSLMTLPLTINPEDTVLVVMQADNSFDLPDGPIFVPAGTRLIGEWSPEQPSDSSACAVIVVEETWHFPIEHITVSHLSEGLLPWQEQARIAQESLACAEEQEQEQHDEEAARLYAQAIVELEASGKIPLELTDVRHKRALLLRKVGDASGALLEFERYAHAYEADAFLTGYREVDRNAVELAVWGYISMGSIILHGLDYSEAALQQKLHLVARRLLELLTYIARRYTTKVEGLLTAAEMYLALNDKSEARSLFEQAAGLYYRQQIGFLAGTDGISRHLVRLQETFGGTKHKPGPAPRRKARKKRTVGKRGTR
jgi:hypothetical protein